MTHIKVEEYPNGCLFGLSLEGGLNTDAKKEFFIKIKRFSCEVKDSNEKCEEMAYQEYEEFELFGVGYTMSGNRGIIEPAETYEKFRTKKGTHAVIFIVKGFPAVCYFDRGFISRKALSLTQVKTPEFQARG
jgi:hypothetical protein